MKTLVTTIITLATMACAPPPDQGIPLCDVIDDANTQALQRLQARLDFVLDDELGGLICSADIDSAASCQPLLDEQCIGELDATVGVVRDVTVTLRAQQITIPIRRVAVESDCGWSLDDEAGFNIDAGSEVPLQLTFLGAAVGRCEGRLLIATGTADQAETGNILTVPLRATVVAD